MILFPIVWYMKPNGVHVKFLLSSNCFYSLGESITRVVLLGVVFNEKIWGKLDKPLSGFRL